MFAAVQGLGMVGVGRRARCVWVLSVCVLLSACGLPRPKDAPVLPAPSGAVAPTCVAATAGNQLVGSWYLVTKQSGVAGEIQTLLTLSADGSLRQQTRVKQGRNIRSELRETGCWEAPKGKLVTRVSKSNGELIDFNDPIYSTIYVVEKVDSTRLMYHEDRPNSRTLFAKKVQDGFRLM